MKTTVELIDWKIKQHTVEAEKHERSVRSYQQQVENESAAAKIYRDAIAELEESKSILLQHGSQTNMNDPRMGPPNPPNPPGNRPFG